MLERQVKKAGQDHFEASDGMAEAHASWEPQRF
jgi:hypothetical protein